jgi:hypothetical protein
VEQLGRMNEAEPWAEAHGSTLIQSLRDHGGRTVYRRFIEAGIPSIPAPGLDDRLRASGERLGQLRVLRPK